MSNAAIIAGAAVGAALYVWFKNQQPPPASPVQPDTGSEPEPTIFDSITSGAESAGEFIQAGFNTMGFTLAKNLPGNAAYVERCREVEQQRGIPADMLVRLAYQESRFRNDIITGAVVSSAGAKGMFQLMPIHWKYVDPVDWYAAADYAGGELARLYRRFGTWALALAAYNWGEGNLQKYGIASAPTETRNYYNQILADIGLGVVTYA